MACSNTAAAWYLTPSESTLPTSLLMIRAGTVSVRYGPHSSNVVLTPWVSRAVDSTSKPVLDRLTSRTSTPRDDFTDVSHGSCQPSHRCARARMASALSRAGIVSSSVDALVATSRTGAIRGRSNKRANKYFNKKENK